MITKRSEAYQNALDYVFKFIDYSRTHQENIAAENFHLERMHQFLAILEDPHKKYKTIHVAGTKGKGSVSALCAGALQAQGYKVGLYTSPHLHEFTERIQIDRIPVSQPDFAKLVNQIKSAVDQVPQLTSYEIQTALAFLHFAQEKVDIAVIEVGLGGRLDSTNVVSPLVSGITSLSLDHTFILGNTLAEIAGEKGGIIKENTPVVTAPQEKEASDMLKQIAKEKNANYTEISKDIQFQVEDQDLEGQTISVGGEISLRSTLLGPHQAENMALAYLALDRARERGLTISNASITKGFSEVKWPGRFEIVQKDPYLIFDGAHNQHSAKMLVKTLIEYFPDIPVSLVFGASEDKDIDGMFQELLPYVQVFIPVKSTHPRAANPKTLAQKAEKYSPKILKSESIDQAFDLALTSAEGNGLILVTGSLYLVGEARFSWFTRVK